VRDDPTPARRPVSHVAQEAMMTKKILTGMALCLGLCAVAPSAHADPTRKDDNYGYDFKDDILQAGGNDANAMLLKVMKPRSRERLLRPRVHFVAEMLKSVESL
jgi:hypothetical protein